MSEQATLLFDGRFQCRLATNPDPTDEKWGVSGTTFALMGEGPLDRIIRWSDPKYPRVPGPRVGVQVVSVSVDGKWAPLHPLLGAPVALVDAEGLPPDLRSPRFQAGNEVLMRIATQCIDPFCLHIGPRITEEGKRLEIFRRDPLDEKNTQATIYDVTDEKLLRRRAAQFQVSRASVSVYAGVKDFTAYFEERRAAIRAALEELRAHPSSSLEYAQHETALLARLEKLTDAMIAERADNMGWIETQDFALRGEQCTVSSELFDGRAQMDRPWPITLWMGGWDRDSLTGHVRGELRIPLAARNAPWGVPAVAWTSASVDLSGKTGGLAAGREQSLSHPCFSSADANGGGSRARIWTLSTPLPAGLKTLSAVVRSGIKAEGIGAMPRDLVAEKDTRGFAAAFSGVIKAGALPLRLWTGVHEDRKSAVVLTSTKSAAAIWETLFELASSARARARVEFD